ncbi:MAG: hypothetical protein EOO45_23795, partial [Flavobacterium sp.]
MNTEIFGIIAMFGITILLAIPFGKYIARVYTGDNTWGDSLFNPLEKLIYRFSGIDSKQEMNWKQHLKVMLVINFLWFVMGMGVLICQGWLPLNPDSNPNMTPELAFNTSISFMVNCNLQHYSGESGVSYLSQLFLMFLQFVSAGTGLAAAAVLFNALRERSSEKLDNFYNYFIKSCTRILLPVSLIVATILVFNGTPMTFEGKQEMVTLQGDTVQVSTGPVAAFTAIKHVGTNGGGFFGANSAHPLENPSYLTNMVEMVAQNRLSHALLFLGKEGAGTLPLALAFAQYVSLLPTKEAEPAGLFGEPLAITLPATPAAADAWMENQPSYSKARAMVHPDIH